MFRRAWGWDRGAGLFLAMVLILFPQSAWSQDPGGYVQDPNAGAYGPAYGSGGGTNGMQQQADVSACMPQDGEDRPLPLLAALSIKVFESLSALGDYDKVLNISQTMRRDRMLQRGPLKGAGYQQTVALATQLMLSGRGLNEVKWLSDPQVNRQKYFRDIGNPTFYKYFGQFSKLMFNTLQAVSAYDTATNPLAFQAYRQRRISKQAFEKIRFHLTCLEAQKKALNEVQSNAQSNRFWDWTSQGVNTALDTFVRDRAQNAVVLKGRELKQAGKVPPQFAPYVWLYEMIMVYRPKNIQQLSKATREDRFYMEFLAPLARRAAQLTPLADRGDEEALQELEQINKRRSEVMKEKLEEERQQFESQRGNYDSIWIQWAAFFAPAAHPYSVMTNPDNPEGDPLDIEDYLESKGEDMSGGMPVDGRRYPTQPYPVYRQDAIDQSMSDFPNQALRVPEKPPVVVNVTINNSNQNNNGTGNSNVNSGGGAVTSGMPLSPQGRPGRGQQPPPDMSDYAQPPTDPGQASSTDNSGKPPATSTFTPGGQGEAAEEAATQEPVATTKTGYQKLPRLRSKYEFGQP